MAIRNSTAVRNAMVAAYESAVGVNPVLEIRTGAPAQSGLPTASPTGTLIAAIQLPPDWMTNPANGATGRNGTWTAVAGATGVAGHYRLMNADSSVCHETGTIGTTSAADLVINNTNINSGQEVNISAWNLTAAFA